MQTPSGLQHAVEQMTAFTQQWQQFSEQIVHEMDGSLVSTQREEFTLVVSPATQVSQLTVHPAGIEAGITALRELILDAYAGLCTKITTARAEAISHVSGNEEIAQAIKASLPEQIAERAEGLEAAEEEPGEGEELEAAADEPDDLDDPTAVHTPRAPEVPDEQTPAAPAPLRLVRSPRFGGTLAETMSDVPGWDQARHEAAEPHKAQGRLDAQIAALREQASDMVAAMRDLSVERTGELVVVKVNGGGGLLDLSFRPEFRQSTAEQVSLDFARTYALAVREAIARAQELSAGLEASPQDPSAAMLADIGAGAQHVIHSTQNH